MNIDRSLKLVIPIYDDELKNIVAHVHSTPLALETVIQYEEILAMAFQRMAQKNLIGPTCPAVSIVKTVATDEGKWDDPPNRPGTGVQNGLMAEIYRLTNVAVKKEDGWHAVPLPVAVQQGIITAQDAREVDNAVVFFTVVSAVAPRVMKRDLLESLGAFEWQVSSSTSTEFLSSLKTSSATASSGAKSHAPAHAGPGRATATRDGKPSSVPV